MGVSAGFPDYLVFPPIGKFGTLVPVAIEMKQIAKGSATPEQKQWLKDLEKVGFRTAVCHGAAEAVAFLKELGYIDDMPDFKRLAEPF